MPFSRKTLVAAGGALLSLGTLSSHAFVSPPLPPSGLASSVAGSCFTAATSIGGAPKPRSSTRIAALSRQRQERAGAAAPLAQNARRQKVITRAVRWSARGVGPLHNSSDDDADIDGNGKKKNSFQKGSWALGSDGGKREDDAAIDGKGEEVNSFKKGSWALGSDKGKPKEMVARKKRKKVAAKVPAPGKYVSRPPPPTVIASEKARGVGDPSKRSALKQKLLRKVATLNRGFVAQDADRVEVKEIIEMLELENPNPKACESFKTRDSPIAGRWQLLYTTSLNVLSLQINPAVTIGQIFQEIGSDGRSIQNIIEIQPSFAAVSNRILGSSLTTLTVKLKSEPVSDTRIDLKFIRTEVKADSIFGRKLNLPTLGVNIPSETKLQKILASGKVRLVEAMKDRKRKEKKETVRAVGGAPKKRDQVKSNGEEGEAKRNNLWKPHFETTYVDEDLRVGRITQGGLCAEPGPGDLYVSVRA